MSRGERRRGREGGGVSDEVAGRGGGGNFGTTVLVEKDGKTKLGRRVRAGVAHRVEKRTKEENWERGTGGGGGGRSMVTLCVGCLEFAGAKGPRGVAACHPDNL